MVAEVDQGLGPIGIGLEVSGLPDYTRPFPMIPKGTSGIRSKMGADGTNDFQLFHNQNSLVL